MTQKKCLPLLGRLSIINHKKISGVSIQNKQQPLNFTAEELSQMNTCNKNRVVGTEQTTESQDPYINWSKCFNQYDDNLHFSDFSDGNE